MAAENQLIACCQEGCLIFLLHCIQRSVILGLNGGLTDISMGCAMQVQSAGINTKGVSSSSAKSGQ